MQAALKTIEVGGRVFTVALGEGVDTATMTEIAEMSEGSFYHAENADDVEGIYENVITYLHYLHRLWYSSSFGAFDGSRRELEVEHLDTGVRHSAEYIAPEDEYWSHTILLQRDNAAAPVTISPDGQYVSQIQYQTLIRSDGRRLTRSYWKDRYDGMMTEHFVCSRTHRHYGLLERYDPDARSYEKIEESEIVSESTDGEFHRDWDWRPKGISNNEKYLVMCADPGDWSRKAGVNRLIVFTCIRVRN